MHYSILLLICLTSLEGSPLQLKMANPLTNGSTAIRSTIPTTTTTTTEASIDPVVEVEEEEEEYEYPEIDPILGFESTTSWASPSSMEGQTPFLSWPSWGQPCWLSLSWQWYAAVVYSRTAAAPSPLHCV